MERQTALAGTGRPVEVEVAVLHDDDADGPFAEPTWLGINLEFLGLLQQNGALVQNDHLVADLHVCSLRIEWG